MPKNKKNLRRMIFFLLMILWMSVIFFFSAQDGGESGALSDRLADALHSPIWILRKGAHMGEFALLGLLAAGWTDTLSFRHRFLPAWVIAAVYAAADEFHQRFVPGRTAAIRDVCIDAVGAAAGVLVMLFVLKKIREKIARKTAG